MWSILNGTIVNTVTVILGSLVGLSIGARLPARYQQIVLNVLGLVTIKGVGRVIARGLYAAGFKNPREVTEANLARLEKVPGVGRKRAAKIKEAAVQQCMR